MRSLAETMTSIRDIGQHEESMRRTTDLLGNLAMQGRLVGTSRLPNDMGSLVAPPLPSGREHLTLGLCRLPFGGEEDSDDGGIVSLYCMEIFGFRAC